MSQEQYIEHSRTRKQILMGLVVVFFIYFTFSFAIQTLPVARPKELGTFDTKNL